jgi:hypothetical protein
MKALPSVSRRWLALAAGLTAALLIIPTASARSAASIKGVGAGETVFGFTEFELSAHAEADPTTPENGFGQVKIEFPPGSFTIDVRCVNADVIVGRPSARISGVITRSTLTGPVLGVGTTAVVSVSDGGEPSSDVPVDGFTFSSGPPPAETVCLGRPGLTLPNVTQGNIVVKL